MTSTQAPTKQWADGPLPLTKTPMFETGKDDIFTKGASHMALLHSAVLRGFNSIYLQAPHVKSDDYANFIGYAQTWFKFVKGHHDGEEATLFPKIEELTGKKDIFSETYHEHETFMPGLVAYNEYLTAAAADPSSFSGAKLVEIMDSFSKDFNHHFHSEISTIANLSSLGSSIPPEVGPALNSWGRSSVMGAGLTDVVPFIFMNFDRSDDYDGGMWKGWPPMPKPVLWGLVNIGGSYHWGWWKYASCSANGMPRELYALSN